MALSANCGPVVIADEDATARRELAHVFEAAGYDVVQVGSGEEVLRAVEEATPCVVLLEIPLGSLSGYEVCRALREATSGIPIVFVSGSRTESYDRVAGLLVGADDYIVKPYAPDELLTRVRALVRRSQPLTLPLTGKLTKRELEVLRLLAGGRDRGAAVHLPEDGRHARRQHPPEARRPQPDPGRGTCLPRGAARGRSLTRASDTS